jgi:hypothetical protein
MHLWGLTQGEASKVIDLMRVKSKLWVDITVMKTKSYQGDLWAQWKEQDTVKDT